MTLFSYIVFTALLIALFLIILARTIATRTFSDREKLSPFECGFDPKTPARTAFSLRFFLLAVVFLVFDIEITFLLPIPMMMMAGTTMSMIYLGIPICLILLLGLLHEWHEGALDWVN